MLPGSNSPHNQTPPPPAGAPQPPPRSIAKRDVTGPARKSRARPAILFTFGVLDGPSKAVSIADILRQRSFARAEARLFIRPRPSMALRFHEHLARAPIEDIVTFSAFLHKQNKEDRAAAQRLDSCPPCNTGNKLDLWG